jgi:16S rRNA (uracil1498-N3)-methyltransferase
MSQRFFVETPISSQHAVLTAAEAHHLLHVMRAGPGDEVLLFDGSGGEFLARIDSLGRSEVQLSIVQRRQIDRELPQRITLGVALPKAQRRGWLVEKLVELGVSRLVPLVTDRVAGQSREQNTERMRRAVIEASKQCGRNRLMQIAEASHLADFLAAAPHGSPRFIAHPTQPIEWTITSSTFNDADVHDAAESSQGGSEVFLAVGPEGGFSDGEIAEARRTAWQCVDLGPRILRTDTAAVAMVAMIARQTFRCTSPADERTAR